MSLVSKDDARNYIKQAELLLQQLSEYKDDIFEGLINEYGKVTNFDSFKSFFEAYMKDCPNPEILKSLDYEHEERRIWSSIDANKSGSLDKDEEIKLVKEIISLSINLIKKYFDI